MRFHRDARSTDQANPDTTRDSADLQQDFDVGAEAEPVQEHEQDQEVQWTTEFEATGSTTGETVSNIRMSGATICDVAGRTRARAGASLSDSHVPVKRSMYETAKTSTSSGDPIPAPTPTLGTAIKALQAGHQISKGKP